MLPRIMHSARRLNDGMGAYVANQTVRCMNMKGVMVKDAKILILGITFKENCPDIPATQRLLTSIKHWRNTQSILLSMILGLIQKRLSMSMVLTS